MPRGTRCSVPAMQEKTGQKAENRTDSRSITHGFQWRPAYVSFCFFAGGARFLTRCSKRRVQRFTRRFKRILELTAVLRVAW